MDIAINKGLSAGSLSSAVRFSKPLIVRLADSHNTDSFANRFPAAESNSVSEVGAA